MTQDCTVWVDGPPLLNSPMLSPSLPEPWACHFMFNTDETKVSILESSDHPFKGNPPSKPKRLAFQRPSLSIMNPFLPFNLAATPPTRNISPTYCLPCNVYHVTFITTHSCSRMYLSFFTYFAQAPLPALLPSPSTGPEKSCFLSSWSTKQSRVLEASRSSCC